jgi:tol-pal system protein YbgF
MKPKLRTSLRMAAAVCALAMALPAPGRAQSSDMQQLLNRMERLQQEMNTLQRYVYSDGKAPPPAAAGAAPPPAAAAIPADATSRTLVARLSLRISQLEGEIRRLTGRNEELSHAITQVQKRVEKLAADVEFRLGALERGGAAPAAAAQPGAGQPTGAAPQPAMAAGGAAAAPQSPAAPPPAPPGMLGTLRTDAAGKPLPPAPGAAAPQVASAPAETPQQQYDRAHALIVKQQNLAEAERVLRDFIKDHPKHELTPNAHYWLGRTYYVRKDFQQAAFTFAEGVQKFPKSEKAPANLLNLGMSLARLGKTKEACTAYARLLQTFPKADAGVKQRVAREQASAKCR